VLLSTELGVIWYAYLSPIDSNEDDTVADLKKMVAAQTGTRAEKNKNSKKMVYHL